MLPKKYPRGSPGAARRTESNVALASSIFMS